MAFLLSRDNRIIFTIFLVTTLQYLPVDVTAGICWYKMETPGFCKETIQSQISKEQCCSDGSAMTAWSPEDLRDSALFFYRTLHQGVPCKACKESCDGVKCGKNKKCAMKNGRPTCVCSPKCKYPSQKKGPVCGTDNKSYKSICQLKKQRCRTKNALLRVNYYGLCQYSCKNVKCKRGKYCVQDQYLRAHCVRCNSYCGNSYSWKSPVCGDNGVTYPNACQMQSASCFSGRPIRVAYKEACKSNATCENIHCSVGEKCLMQKETNLPKCVSCSSCEEKKSYGPLCGTNNQTYNSLCEILWEACHSGYFIEANAVGPCKLGIAE